MWYKFPHRFETRHCGIALAVLLSTVLSLPAGAAEVWKVNIAKSKFGPSSNTLVLERDKANTANPGASKLLVISNQKIYLAMDEAAYNASSPGIRAVSYSNWRGMKLVQIGDHVRSTDICGFHCQSGVPDPRMTLTFVTKGVDASKDMDTVLALGN